MIALDDDWVWDSWYAWDTGTLHAFYLKAPKSLGDPNLRHVNARVGHSTSVDGRNWVHHQDALQPSAVEAFDDRAIWTGSVLQHEGLWHMFYTGIDQSAMGRIQRVGHATSSDLFNWTRVQVNPILSAQHPQHATALRDERGEEPFRDPWVFWHEDQWHMLVTARSTEQGVRGNGNMAHATSQNLYDWSLQEPLLSSTGFDQLEVFQVVEVDGRWFLIFCTQPADVHRPGVPKSFTTYAAPADGPLGPFHLDEARPITEGSEGIYAGRIVRMPDGTNTLLGFIESGEPGGFGGVISDPLPVVVSAEGALVLDVEQPSSGGDRGTGLYADVTHRS